MIDVAKHSGINIDIKKLSEIMGVTVLPTIGSRRIGISELKNALRSGFRISPAVRKWKLPEIVREEQEELVGFLVEHGKLEEDIAYHDAAALISTTRNLDEFNGIITDEVLEHVQKDHDRLKSLGFDRYTLFVESRYQWIHSICSEVISVGQKKKNYTDKIDAIVTHKFWGYAIFLILMILMFQSIFTWALVPMNLISDGFNWLGNEVGLIMPPGDLRDLLINGVISGVGAVVTFLPQIILLFLFMGILEDTGYMARAAFIMDRLMSKVGLHGKAFIPMLSSFACAIPGIMATRTIENPRDRLVTILVAPLMSCSARLPVYSLLIAAFIPGTLILGFWNLQGIVMVSLYLLGVVMALIMAGIFKKTILKGKSQAFILELPPYRIPSLRNIFLQIKERSMLFLKRAGTIILGVSIILWFLATYPKLQNGSLSQKLSYSFVGRAGQLIEPVIKPLGFDWKVGVGILSSLLQREVFVSTISTIYNIQSTGDKSVSIRSQMQKDVNLETGLPYFTVQTAICVMVYYVLAMQCMSTLAVVRRETNSWKWPLFQLVYMTSLAYIVTFIVYQVGLLFM